MPKKVYLIPVGIPMGTEIRNPALYRRLPLLGFLPFMPSYVAPVPSTRPTVGYVMRPKFSVCNQVQFIKNLVNPIRTAVPQQNPTNRRIILKMPRFDYAALDDRI